MEKRLTIVRGEGIGQMSEKGEHIKQEKNLIRQTPVF